MTIRFESLATGRQISLLQKDFDEHRGLIHEALANRSVIIIGAAGSIGSALVKELLQFGPAEVVLIDLNENNLVELVRDLRASNGIQIPERFSALPIGLGSHECLRFLVETPFDYLFNLSALKHVRSEKHAYSLMRMVDTNILFLDDLLTALTHRCRKLFSVSSDKATNPAGMMGASKFVMERVLHKHSERQPFSTARFANVAFSEGSLLFSFLKRIEKQQPIAAPTDVRRFFVSQEEAGQLCLLSGILGKNREAFFPKLRAGNDEKTFAEIAVALLHTLGYDVHECSSEDEAKQEAAELIRKKQWPCLFTTTNTSGEKSHEEFFSDSDTLDRQRFEAIGIIQYPREPADQAALAAFIDFARAARTRPVAKSEYVDAFRSIVPNFNHVETEKNLDQKM